MPYIGKYRQTQKDESNNNANPNQNVCALAVARALKVQDSVRYLHNMRDIVRAARTRFLIRSRMTDAKAKNKSVGAIRANLAAIGALGYIVRVDGHVLLLDAQGQTLVDTDSRKRDRRKVTHVYGIYPKMITLKNCAYGMIG